MTTNGGPFIGTEALRAGEVTRRGLQRDHRRVYRNVYLPKDEQLTAALRAKAAWLWAGREGTLGGLSAAAMHGSKWIDADVPAELFRHCDAADGIRIHHDKLWVDEVCAIGGIPTTTPVRTAFDIGRADTLELAVMRLDALANATGLDRGPVDALIRRRAGARGIVALRAVVDLMDGGAESPQETRTRLLMIAAGFPRPETQIVVCDASGCFVGRVDMGYRKLKVGIEYDGPQHWATPADHAHDIERLCNLEAQGWTIVRLTRDILRYRSHTFLVRVRDAMTEAGWLRGHEIRLDARIADIRVQ
jgi:hypothetical protein